MHNNTGKAGFLLIIPGTLLLGLGIGLALGQPGFGAIIGLGAAMLLWGSIVVLKNWS